jgi:hypothetical protein
LQDGYDNEFALEFKQSLAPPVTDEQDEPHLFHKARTGAKRRPRSILWRPARSALETF